MVLDRARTMSGKKKKTKTTTAVQQPLFVGQINLPKCKNMQGEPAGRIEASYAET